MQNVEELTDKQRGYHAYFLQGCKLRNQSYNFSRNVKKLQ